MADENQIQISIVLDDGSVRQGFIRVQKQGEDAAAGIGASFKRAGEVALGVFAGQKALEIFNALAAKVKEVFVESVGAAREYEKNVQGLNVALGVAGRYSEAASQQFQDLANKIQDTTTVSDDTVLSLERLAITYSKTNEQALNLTKASVDLAAVTGNDVNTAMQQLAGTLSGQAGRLQRLFPDLQNFTSAQLKAGAAVDFFNSRFSGAAAAQVNTFDGRMKQLKNSYDDFLKVIGKEFTGSPAVIAAIKAITDLIKDSTGIMKTAFSGKDFFKDVIVNFSVIAQAGVETARRIGLSFELAYLRAKQAWYAFKVLSTAGFSETFNTQLQEVLVEIEKVKNEFGQDSTITKWFDNLILKVTEAAKVTKEKFKDLGGESEGLKASINSVGQTFSLMSAGAKEAMLELHNTGVKVFRELGGTAIKGLAGGVAAGMAAIGKALVKGEDLFQAFAGAMLSALGQAAIQMGATYILMGIARAFSSYGLDPTATGLIATGSAMSVLGGALMAVGGGISGGNSASTDISSGGGGGSFSSGAGGGSEFDQSYIRKTDGPSIAVNIHGDVLDSKESGLRIVELINSAFKDQGAKVIQT